MHTLGRHAWTHALLAAGLVLAIAPEARADTPCVPSALLNLASSLTCTTAGDIILSGTTVSVTSSGTLDLTVRQGDTIQANAGFGALSFGATTITNNGILAGYVAGVDVIGGTAIITNNGVIKSTATSDGSGIVIVGAGSATITNGPTGVIQGTAHAGIMVSTTAPTTTITNYGNIISGGVLSGGIKISSANTATVDQYGVITATATGSAGIWLTAASARVNLNIREGSSFAGLGLKMDDPAYTGSTIRFYAANYSLSVQNFLLANHTVTAMSPGAHVDLVGADKANGNGNLVVYTPAPAPAPTMPAATAAAATAVQSAIQVSVPRNVVPTVPQAPPMSSSALQTTLPVQNTLPEFGTAGSGATGGGSSGSGGPSNLGMSESAMSNLGMRGTYDATPRNAQAFDRYGNLVWARAFGSARFQRPSDDIAGSVNRTGGVLMGYDRQFTDWRLGVYMGYGLSYTDLSDGSAKLATDLYLGGLYARTKFAGYTLTANLGGGLLDNHSSRIINAGAEIAAAQFGGAFIAPDIALGIDIGLGQGWMLTPSIRGRYIGTYTRDYAETGSTQNIAYQNAFSHSLEERAEVRLTHTTRLPFGERFSSYVQAAAIATQRIGSGAVSASILGTEISIQNSVAASLAGLSLGTGLDVDLTRQITAYAGVDAMEYSDASKAIAARLGLRVAF